MFRRITSNRQELLSSPRLLPQEQGAVSDVIVAPSFWFSRFVGGTGRKEQYSADCSSSPVYFDPFPRIVKQRCFTLLGPVLLVLTSLLFALTIIVVPPRNKNGLTATILSEERMHSRGYRGVVMDIPVTFDCPSSKQLSYYMESQDESSSYNRRSQAILQNFTYFVEHFRTNKFDGWSTYNNRKQEMYEWKLKHFSQLKDGDSIYESACGIGLNMFMTLETLKETQSEMPRNLVLYGNDYVSSSAEVANRLLDALPLPKGARKGVICQADSSRLSHVPSSSFDLVFTGFIAAIWNPLNLTVPEDILKEEDDEYDALGELYLRICKDAGKSDHRLKAQQVQEDWYFRWVNEMVRIAKPGAFVLVESVAPPYCELPKDYGGVSQQFWRDSLSKWGMKEDSLEIMEMQGGRYNVKMEKKS